MAPDQQTPAYDPAAEVVDFCRELIGIDTTNAGDGAGPGERKAAEYVAERLEDVGLETTLLERSSGRTNLLARWEGADPSLPPLLLHGHLDVVPAQADDWRFPPFSGELEGGYVHGRGAIDMKDFDAMILSVLRARVRAGAPPRRPVVLAFTADEEAGSTYGGHWLVDEHPDLLADCTEAIGEVGGWSAVVGDQRLYLVETGEKGLCWMRLTARGVAGHGSMRHPDNVVTRLARAIIALGTHEWPVAPTPSMRRLLEVAAPLAAADPDDADAVLAAFGPAARMLGAGIRNTTNPSMLQAGYKVNVVPAVATARVDGRFLPGQQEEFLETVRSIVGDDVEVEPETYHPALETTFDGDLVDAMTTALLAEDPGAQVVPYLMSGGTDAKAWDRLGIRCFGFTPLRLPADLDFTALFHGVDERVPVDALAFGSRVLDRLLDLA